MGLPSAAAAREIDGLMEPWLHVAGTLVQQARTGRPPDDLATVVLRLEALRCTPCPGYAIHWLPQPVAGLWWSDDPGRVGAHGQLWVFATPHRRMRIQSGDAALGVGLHLRAEVMSLLLGPGMRRVRGLQPAETVLGPVAGQYAAILRSCPDDSHRLAVLVDIVRSRLREVQADAGWHDLRVAALAQTLPYDPQLGSVHVLAARLGVGVRQVERIFQRHLGLTPRTFFRIRRFKRILTLLVADPGQDLALLAADVGCTDQAHLTREFTTFAGMPPRRLLNFPGAGISLPYGVIVVRDDELAEGERPGSDPGMT